MRRNQGSEPATRAPSVHGPTLYPLGRTGRATAPLKMGCARSAPRFPAPTAPRRLPRPRTSAHGAPPGRSARRTRARAVGTGLDGARGPGDAGKGGGPGCAPRTRRQPEETRGPGAGSLGARPGAPCRPPRAQESRPDSRDARTDGRTDGRLRGGLAGRVPDGPVRPPAQPAAASPRGSGGDGGPSPREDARGLPEALTHRRRRVLGAGSCSSGRLRRDRTGRDGRDGTRAALAARREGARL